MAKDACLELPVSCIPCVGLDAVLESYDSLESAEDDEKVDMDEFFDFGPAFALVSCLGGSLDGALGFTPYATYIDTGERGR